MSFGLAHPGEASAVTVDGATITYGRWAGGRAARRGAVHGSNAHRHWWRFLAPTWPENTVAAWTFRATGTRTTANYSGATFAGRSLPFAGGLASQAFVIGHVWGVCGPANGPPFWRATAGDLQRLHRPLSSAVEWGLRASEAHGPAPAHLRDLDEALGRFRLVPEQPPSIPPCIVSSPRQGWPRRAAGRKFVLRSLIISKWAPIRWTASPIWPARAR